jgi:hypothetical protein
MCLYSTYTYAYHSLHKHAYRAYYTRIIILCHMLILLVYKLVRYLPVIQVVSLNRTTLYSLSSLSVHLSHVSIHGYCVTHGCPITDTEATGESVGR